MSSHDGTMEGLVLLPVGDLNLGVWLLNLWVASGMVMAYPGGH